MNKAELFFRAIHKSVESKEKRGRGRPAKETVQDKTKAHGGYEGTTKKMIMPIDFNSRGESFIAELVFTNTYDLASKIQVYNEVAEIYPNKLKRESDKQVVPLSAFLYKLVFNEEQYQEMEEFREAMRDQLSFDKSEIKLLKEFSTTHEETV